MSGGRPPTNTLRENLSPFSEPWERGEEREGDGSGTGAPSPSTRWPSSSSTPPVSSKPSSPPLPAATQSRSLTTCSVRVVPCQPTLPHSHTHGSCHTPHPLLRSVTPHTLPCPTPPSLSVTPHTSVAACHTPQPCCCCHTSTLCPVSSMHHHLPPSLPLNVHTIPCYYCC
ncbi:hypothetical protein E2C01_101849 [Portunus trituberculatus]|uniref:Uncharacterized protein n=1 Tax=Portunus trituberculatus TaxID=210409 RepID=A0A5B7KL24_PORTR|nr:hypothetical protein [Portunus trituberculatus]